MSQVYGTAGEIPAVFYESNYCFVTEKMRK